MERIRLAASPEEAARVGRSAQRASKHLIRPDWDTVKVGRRKLDPRLKAHPRFQRFNLMKVHVLST